jgi:hypothetical protein
MPASRVFSDESMCWHLLSSAEAMMDVTLMDGCLVCSAYKAVAVGEPTILSDNAASKELFAGVAVFADNAAAEIVAAVCKRAGVRAQMASGVGDAARRLRSDRRPMQVRCLRNAASWPRLTSR